MNEKERDNFVRIEIRYLLNFVILELCYWGDFSEYSIYIVKY